ncbi:phosphopantothenoylcysteine decarboxylase [Streptomyces sp. A3M-1-3]|uniref:flavoprotein n=1 Tax=Streptomyces sp. A3M-1-3 TaxID=2962044 RepID=UPI0020B855AC|nr:flavoprotein [Streptomyces sp. A3M-1-3]MCP3821636.1 phosphopantothenoylcysteine decarboxylase [Streptomyces sp. A3M-1-3]
MTTSQNDRTVPAGGGSAQGRPEIALPRGRVLLVGTGAFGVTGLPSWALLMRMWYGWSLRACLTSSADRLVSREAVAAATRSPVAGPEWNTADGVVPHLELAEWPDLVVVAPATTAFIAKCAVGMPDSLALSTVLATRAPVVMAPSIPEHTLSRRSVQRNLELVREDGFHVAPMQPAVSAHKGMEIASGMPNITTVLRFAAGIVRSAGDVSTVAATEAPADAAPVGAA